MKLQLSIDPPPIWARYLEQCNFNELGTMCLFYWEFENEIHPSCFTVAVWKIKPKQ